MKTTLDLPVDLLEEAMKESRCPTKTATIVAALEQLVRSAKLARLQSLRGSLPDFKLDLAFAAGSLGRSDTPRLPVAEATPAGQGTA